eukprot:763954-Hanusia_phi.AAC.6
MAGFETLQDTRPTSSSWRSAASSKASMYCLTCEAAVAVTVGLTTVPRADSEDSLHKEHRAYWLPPASIGGD